MLPNLNPDRFSQSDRQQLVKTLTETRHLAKRCASAEHHSSPLRRKCERLRSVIDAVTSELIGTDRQPEG
jgi:hypothetical protein